MQNIHIDIWNSKPQNFNQVEIVSINAQKVLNLQNISFPLSTSGIKIVDSNGKKVRLVGVNWSGGHLIRQCPSGLDKRSLHSIIDKIKNHFKFNCVRLCYSVQMIFDQNSLDQKYISANKDLYGLTPFQILNTVIQALTKQGIMVILNCHTSKSQWCCSNTDEDGLWYNNQFPEDKFYLAAEKLAFRHKGNFRVIGMDLRNQIRPANGITPQWGTGDKSKDWKIAAEKCAQKILNICPEWLIFIGGLNYQLDLTPVFNHPIKLSVPNKLVYTGHLYDKSWNDILSSMGYKNQMENLPYEIFQEIFYKTQMFVRALGYPFLLGEFGHHSPVQYWNLLQRYIKEKDLDFTYWCLDGYKCEEQSKGDQSQHFGFFQLDFQTERHPFKADFCRNCACGNK